MNKYQILLTSISMLVVLWIVTTDFALGIIFIERILAVLLVININFLLLKK